jgi:diguanylate cyclase (GGDEF)-like protein
VAVEEREALLNVSQVVNSCDKLETALDSALLMLRSIVPAARCAAIYLTDEGGSHLVRQADIGKRAGEELSDRVRLDSLIDNWSLGAVEPYVSRGETASVMRNGPTNASPGSYCYVGLRSLNLPVGLLFVDFDGPNPPDAIHLRMLRGFGERIGFPIHKIRMQEGLHNLAYTDPMTGLQNYRAFRSNLDDEWKRASRYRRPLSLILIDLDHFKDINDRYGHPAGDRLLAGLADILRDTVRETDVPARYGGEEFVVVCPETSEMDAEIVAERIRAAVESARFRIESRESTAITCSLGIATFPSNATTEEALIDAADAALYYAKRCGKNVVRSADSLPFLASDTGS